MPLTMDTVFRGLLRTNLGIVRVQVQLKVSEREERRAQGIHNMVPGTNKEGKSRQKQNYFGKPFPQKDQTPTLQMVLTLTSRRVSTLGVVNGGCLITLPE